MSNSYTVKPYTSYAGPNVWTPDQVTVGHLDVAHGVASPIPMAAPGGTGFSGFIDDATSVMSVQPSGVLQCTIQGVYLLEYSISFQSVNANVPITTTTFLDVTRYSIGGNPTTFFNVGTLQGNSTSIAGDTTPVIHYGSAVIPLLPADQLSITMVNGSAANAVRVNYNGDTLIRVTKIM